MGGLVSLAGPCPVNYQGLCCADAASYWLTGLGQEEVGLRNLRDLGLVLLTGRQSHHILGWVVVGLGFPDPVLAYWWMGLFPGMATLGYRVSQSWFWSVGESA